MHPGRKLQRTTKGVSIWLRFIAMSTIELMKSENFLRWVTTIFRSAEYWVKCVLIYLYTWYTSWSKQYDTKRKNLVNFHLGSCQVSLAVKKRILPEEDFTLDNWTQLVWDRKRSSRYHTHSNEQVKTGTKKRNIYSVCLVNKEAFSEILHNLNFRQLAPRSIRLHVFKVKLNKMRKGI